MKIQTDPPSSEFEPLVRLRKPSRLDRSLRRANLAAWLMADENPFEDKEIQGQPCGGEPARSTTPEEEVNENKGEKPSPIRAVSNWLSRGSR